MAVALSSALSGGVSALWYHELPACNSTFKPFAPLGCYNMTGPDVLEMQSEANLYNMTQNKCAAICKGNGFRFAGLAYIGACYCGAAIEYSAPVAMDNCFYDCSGDKREKCGGNNYMNIFEDTTFPNTSTSSIHDYKYRGCWNDSGLKNGRALGYGQNIPGDLMTTEKCLRACLKNGYRFGGTEYYNQCFCGVVLDEESALVPESECNTPCTGNPTQMCGGAGRLSVYENDDCESTEPCGDYRRDLSYPPPRPSTPATPAPPPPGRTQTSPAGASTPLTPPSSSEPSPESSESSSPPPPPASWAPPPPPPPPSAVTSVPPPPYASTSRVCVSTVAPSPNDQWCLGGNKWQSNPLPSWKDAKSCMASVSDCLAQVESCFKTGKWPDSMGCLDFKDWCSDVAQCCQGGQWGGKDKERCLAVNPPSCPPNNKPSTVTVPCSATPKPLPPASTRSSPARLPAPTPSTLCRQPESQEHNYGRQNPVGGIDQPIVQCNNIESEFNWGAVLKLYDEKDSRKCRKYRREQMPQACQEACQMQYSHCQATYARGCYSHGQHRGKDHGPGTQWEKREGVGAFGSRPSRGGDNRWDCDGEAAEAACLHQYKGCRGLNRAHRMLEDKCEAFARDD